MERKKTRSPAVTLLIREPKEISVDVVLTLEANQSWPPSTQEGLPIKQWLGGKVKKALKLQPYCLVPKPAEEGSGLQGILNVKVNLKAYKRVANVTYEGSKRSTAVGISRAVRLNRPQDGNLVRDGVEKGIVIVVISNTQL